MVIVAEQVLIDHAQVVTESVSGQNAGYAGNISLTARQLELRNQSLIGTGAVQAGGGTIALYVGERVRLSQSVVSTAVRGGAGDAGNIIIGLATENTGEQLLNSQFIILNDSVVRANAFGGDGGNINIAAQVFLASPASILSASSALGNPGQIDVRSPVTDIRGTFAPLPEGFLAADALLHKRCAERVGGAAPSSFVVRGRDGVPVGPESVLPSRSTLKGHGETQAKGKDTSRRQQRTRRLAAVSLPALQAVLEKIGHTDALLVRCRKLAR